MKYFDKLNSFNKSSIAFFGLIQIAILGVIDFYTGYEVSFAFFYLIPVALMAWYAGKNIAVISAILSAIIWQLVNRGAGEHFSSEWIPIWNTMTRLGFFIVVVYLLLRVKDSLQHESTLARTDHLTGAANQRSFYETTEKEMARARRYKRKLTVCYFDADNFKRINDTLGHHTGSELLVRVVNIVKNNTRETDVIARLGGDEFAILLPETDQEQARIVVGKVREKLLSDMDKENWAVTFSMGVLTCLEYPGTVEELIDQADALMYEVKNNGKNSVKFKELTYASIDSKTI